MSFETEIYLPSEIFNSYEDIDILKFKLERFSRKTLSKLKKSDFDYIINFAILILYEYFEKSCALFFSIQQLKQYIKISLITAFWISYKFLADEDDIYASDLAFRLKLKTNEFIAKEREILLFINYNLFKLLKIFNEEENIFNKKIKEKQLQFRSSV